MYPFLLFLNKYYLY